MEILKFECELLSDVILNEKSATEGNRSTLDFIPGNNFLGIVAGKLYKEGDLGMCLQILHSGEVKFGDAHPSMQGVRGLKVPASLFFPKLDEKKEYGYIHHYIPDFNSAEIKNLQLKQCRTGYYAVDSKELVMNEIRTTKSFTIKSAYDPEKRRSRDEKMFGYEALRTGLKLIFEIVLSDRAKDYREVIIAALEGKKRIGRSRSAQFGLVEIKYIDTESVDLPNKAYKKGVFVTVYADSRLIFFDEYGVPAFKPTALDLGIANGNIIWEKSQLRGFQFAPWNFKRQMYDADRCGIEKGSVFVVELAEDTILPDFAYVGYYQNEGFGKVLYNAVFLDGDGKGKALYKMARHKPSDDVPIDQEETTCVSSPLVSFLMRQKELEERKAYIYACVNQFVSYNVLRFKEKTFASQWGTIRSYAMKYRGNELKDKIIEYLSHGIASSKWNEKGRLNNLRIFIDQFSEDNYDALQEAIVNLSAEMGKECSRTKKGKL